MTTKLTVVDEAPNGIHKGSVDLELPSETTTLREILRARVYQEVQDFNVQKRELFRGLVQPEGATAESGGFRPRRGRTLDWQKQFDAAVEAFARNGFFVLVDSRQVDALDAPLEIRPGTRVSFVKLVPLVGG